MRKFVLCLAGLFSGWSGAQVPAADDPLWEYPAAAAFHSPTKPDCDLRVTVPGEKYCLQPAGTPSAWLRADEIARSGNVDVWRGSRGMLQQKDLFLRPSMALDRFSGLPAVKFENFAEMETGAAVDFGIRRFTLFIVGRKIPGAEFGGIFGHQDDPQYGALYWRGAKELTLNVQSAYPLTWQYEGVEEFHLIALCCDFATVTAYLNGQPLETQTLVPSKPGYPPNRGVAFTHVGRYGMAPPTDAAGRMNARGPRRGSEFAEIVTYGHTLTDDEFIATTRYLIKKYGIAIPGREQPAASAGTPAEVYTLAAANDPAEQALANQPVMLGFNSPTAKQCSFSAGSGEPGFCLRPADGMQAWLRGDDVWTRTTILKVWKSPPVIANEATGGEAPGNTGWLVPNSLAGLPTVRIGDRTSLRLKTPVSGREFTVFVVGRQTPGSSSGNITSSDANDQSLSWFDGKTLRLRSGTDAVAEFDDPSATEFHMAAITYRDGTAVAYVGDAPGQARAIALPSGMRFDFLGIPSSTTPQGPSLRSFGAFQARPPENPSTGADLAEVIVWPRALSQADMEATRRYLRKKYSLP